MDYFFMELDPNPKTVGKSPQIEKEYDGFHVRRPYAAWGVQDINPTTAALQAARDSGAAPTLLKGFKLRHHSKSTDWVSVGALSYLAMLVSTRFYDLLQQFDCMTCFATDSEVLHHGKEYTYKLLYFPDTYPQFLDFQKSRFYIGFTDRWEEDVKLSSYEEYITKREELEEIRAKTGVVKCVELLEMYFDKAMVGTKDFFRIPTMARYFVSARLKEAIEAAKMTGMVFTPAQGHKFRVFDRSIEPPREVA
jgi:hypothetical protein